MVKVETKPVPGYPDYIGYQVSGDTKIEVENAVFEIVDGPNVDQSSFREPRREGSKYVARGFVKPRIGEVE